MRNQALILNGMRDALSADFTSYTLQVEPREPRDGERLRSIGGLELGSASAVQREMLEGFVEGQRTSAVFEPEGLTTNFDTDRGVGRGSALLGARSALSPAPAPPKRRRQRRRQGVKSRD